MIDHNMLVRNDKKKGKCVTFASKFRIARGKAYYIGDKVYQSTKDSKRRLWMNFEQRTLGLEQESTRDRCIDIKHIDTTNGLGM